MSTGTPIFDEFELSGLAAILPPEVTRLIRDQQQIINNLVDRVASLESRLEGVEVQLEKHQTNTGRERAYDRQRISKLEKPNKAGPKSKEQIETVKQLLRDSPGHMTAFEVVRLYLRVGKARFSRLLATDEAQDEFLILQSPYDKRKRMLKLRQKL